MSHQSFHDILDFVHVWKYTASANSGCAFSACLFFYSLAVRCNESKKLNTNCPSSQHGTSLCWLHAADITALVGWKFRHPLPFLCKERAASATSCAAASVAQNCILSQHQLCVRHISVFYTCMTVSAHAGWRNTTLHSVNQRGSFFLWD